MSDDLTAVSRAQLEAVERALTVTAGDEGVAVSTVLARTHPTTVEELWAACTTSDRLARWFGQVSGDLELSGRYRIEGNASGTIEHCDPPHGLRITWEFDDDVSWVTARIDPAEGGARLTLEHRADTPRDFWERFGPGAGGVGWDLGLLGLAHHLAGGADATAGQEEWTGTPAGREFITGSSRRWADAWIATGADEDAARGAERRTTAFYLGE